MRRIPRGTDEHEMEATGNPFAGTKPAGSRESRRGELNRRPAPYQSAVPQQRFSRTEGSGLVPAPAQSRDLSEVHPRKRKATPDTPPAFARLARGASWRD